MLLVIFLFVLAWAIIVINEGIMKDATTVTFDDGEFLGGEETERCPESYVDNPDSFQPVETTDTYNPEEEFDDYCYYDDVEEEFEIKVLLPLGCTYEGDVYAPSFPIADTKGCNYIGFTDDLSGDVVYELRLPEKHAGSRKAALAATGELCFDRSTYSRSKNHFSQNRKIGKVTREKAPHKMIPIEDLDVEIDDNLDIIVNKTSQY